jgi:hypothetical protein
MTYDKNDYPEGTILSQLFLDIYANTETGEITILYDTALTEELVGLEFFRGSKGLVFEFTRGKLPLGAPLQDELSEYVEKSKTITLMHINMETKEPISGMEVPLTVLD